MDCREERVLSGTVEGGAMDGRCVLVAVGGFRGIAAEMVSRGVPPADELFEDSCFVGDLLGD